MSGVFGAVDPHGRVDLDALDANIRQTLLRREWDRAHSLCDNSSRVLIGATSIGIFNTAQQPVWNNDRTVAICFSGECYRPGADHFENSPEAAALALYEEHGDLLARHLFGTFAIVVHDLKTKRVLILTDRFNTYPVFYAQKNNALVFGSEMKIGLLHPDVKKCLDWTAFAQSARMQCVLGERTFFEDVRFLPPASVLMCDARSGEIKVQPYWSYNDISFRPDISFDDAVVESGRLFRRAVRRMTSGAIRPGVLLSGGLDSRTILGCTERRPISSLSFGAKNSRDVQYAEKIAQMAGSDHVWSDLPNGCWANEFAEQHIELTEGFQSWIHSHGISGLTQARKVMDVALFGMAGDTVFSYSNDDEYVQRDILDDDALTENVWQMHTQTWQWNSLSNEEEATLYAESNRKRLRGLAYESFREEFGKHLRYRPDVRAEYFCVSQYFGRFLQTTVQTFRSHVEVRIPFFDDELFAFAYSLPAHYRRAYRFYFSIIERECPRMAHIAYEKDEKLPTNNALKRAAHSLQSRARRKINRYMRGNTKTSNTLYADYENYVRKELKFWMKDLLLSERARSRGIFDPTSVQQLVDMHLSGKTTNTIGKIAPLMTLEMMMRRFADN